MASPMLARSVPIVTGVSFYSRDVSSSQRGRRACSVAAERTRQWGGSDIGTLAARGVTASAWARTAPCAASGLMAILLVNRRDEFGRHGPHHGCHHGSSGWLRRQRLSPALQVLS